MYIRAGQHQPTGGPRDSLRTHMRAALVYTYMGRLVEGGGIELSRQPLFADNMLR